MRDRVFRLLSALVIAVGIVACTQGPGAGGSQAPAATSTPAAASPSSSGGGGGPGDYGSGDY